MPAPAAGGAKMGAAASIAAKKRRQERRLHWQMLILGDEWVPTDPRSPPLHPRLRQRHMITYRIVNPALKDLERQKKHRSAAVIRKLTHIGKCTERVAAMMYADSAFLDHCFEVLGGYDNIDPADPGRQKLNGEQLQFLSLTQKGEEAAEIIKSGEKWLTREVVPVSQQPFHAWNAEVKLRVDEQLSGTLPEEWDDKARKFVGSGMWEDGAKWLKKKNTDVERAVRFKWPVYVSGLGRGKLMVCDVELGELEMDIQKGNGVVTIKVSWGGGMFAPGDKKCRWIVKPDRELQSDDKHLLREISDCVVNVEDKWPTDEHNRNPMERTIARKMSNDVRYTGLWARDLMIKSGWELNAQKKEQLKMAREETAKNDLTGMGDYKVDPSTMDILRPQLNKIRNTQQHRIDATVGQLKCEGLIQLIDFPILKLLPPGDKQTEALRKKLSEMSIEQLQKAAKSPQASACVRNARSGFLECEYCGLDDSDRKRAQQSDSREELEEMLMSAAVRYDKVDEETDKYLLESELRRWLTVLNYGAEPSDMDVDDVRSPPFLLPFCPPWKRGGARRTQR